MLEEQLPPTPQQTLADLIKSAKNPEEAAKKILKEGYRNIKDAEAYVVHCTESDTETMETEHWIKGVFLDEDLAYALQEELTALDKFFGDVSCDPVHLTILDDNLS